MQIKAVVYHKWMDVVRNNAMEKEIVGEPCEILQFVATEDGIVAVCNYKNTIRVFPLTSLMIQKED